MGWFDLLAVQGTLNSLLQHNSKASVLRCSSFFLVQLSHPYMTTGKTHSCFPFFPRTPSDALSASSYGLPSAWPFCFSCLYIFLHLPYSLNVLHLMEKQLSHISICCQETMLPKLPFLLSWKSAPYLCFLLIMTVFFLLWRTVWRFLKNR